MFLGEQLRDGLATGEKPSVDGDGHCDLASIGNYIATLQKEYPKVETMYKDVARVSWSGMINVSMIRY